MTLIVCAPLAALRVFHLYDREAPLPVLTITPSTYKLMLATATLSVADALMVTLPFN